ncbi:carbohydrate binding domain-containing protein [Desulfosarcina widdelii]|uniref:carbohydrate binding domain-containing protein n=1 Tax=Desulfosarcina widdelii TaxID=947919 RepID=UPI0012D318D9|nr:carbohydrate binding domain-containing protein [Desulfosarcina widdelii]
MKKHRHILILAMALLTVLFFIGGPDYHSSRSFKHFWNLGHILYFSLFPFLIVSFECFRKQKPITQVSIIILAALLLGILVELGQSAFSRTPDTGDLFRNLIGAGVALCFLLPVRKGFPSKLLRLLQLILIILIGLQIRPIAVALIDEQHARNEFPVLSDFQSAQLDRWEGGGAISIEKDIGSRGNRAMRADLDTQLYSGFTLKYFPRNWKGYQWFQFRIYNPSEEVIRITCRIHDKLHTQGPQLYADRFNRTQSIPVGWHTITIPLDDVRMAPAGREMDISQIYAVGFFATQLPHPRTIYIDDVRLIK